MRCDLGFIMVLDLLCVFWSLDVCGWLDGLCFGWFGC